MFVLPHLRHQWQLVYLPLSMHCPSSIIHDIELDTIRLTSIDLVTIDQHRRGGIRSQSADPAIRRDSVNAAGSSDQKRIATLAKCPADIADVGHAFILP